MPSLLSQTGNASLPRLVYLIFSRKTSTWDCLLSDVKQNRLVGEGHKAVKARASGERGLRTLNRLELAESICWRSHRRK